ncbi:SGNH/GDSL hydrolase family protein [Flavicella sediminum]|uniref:SGNH/GDSL hydrolase family protein n=1 Tax=Flavicella sediminum TaxID=2585141 RepID=UPI00111D00BC|nr:SGNH/GDSL hydrolase family protein [Flavicella sediminum]
MTDKIINRFYYFLLGIVICFFTSIDVIAQSELSSSQKIHQNDISYFKTGDRVCFVGNSITNNGEFHHNIFLYHLTRYPEQELAFFNCGISGDKTGGVLARMEDDILINNPTVVVIMLGMNDVNRSLYGLEEASENRKKRMEAAITLYKNNFIEIVNLFLSKNIKVILERPTIYDQTANLETLNHFGVNDALKTCANFIDEVAKEYELSVVDYWTIMNKLNNEMQAKNPSATITSKDRVHPRSTGHLVMAYQFLKAENAPKYVSKVVIEDNKQISKTKSTNCEINYVKKSKNDIVFSVKENALPFPSVPSQKEGLDLVPFNEELNIELLQVVNLSSGSYELTIDGVLIDIFSEVQLNKGINLANYPLTPQYKQALKVREVLEELWKQEAKLRDIKFIEYNKYYKDCPNKENLTKLKPYLESVFSKKYTSSYHHRKLQDYLEYKPNELEIKASLNKLRAKSFDLAKPVNHVFMIKKSKTE